MPVISILHRDWNDAIFDSMSYVLAPVLSLVHLWVGHLFGKHDHTGLNRHQDPVPIKISFQTKVSIVCNWGRYVKIGVVEMGQV